MLSLILLTDPPPPVADPHFAGPDGGLSWDAALGDDVGTKSQVQMRLSDAAQTACPTPGTGKIIPTETPQRPTFEFENDSLARPLKYEESTFEDDVLVGIDGPAPETGNTSSVKESEMSTTTFPTERASEEADLSTSAASITEPHDAKPGVDSLPLGDQRASQTYRGAMKHICAKEQQVMALLTRHYGPPFIQLRDYKRWVGLQWSKTQPPRESDFTQMRALGRGGFGNVCACLHNCTGAMYAMKTMDRKRVKMRKAMDLCWNERNIMGGLDSPFLVGIKYAYYTPEYLVLIMDLMLGGDLHFWLSRLGHFTKEQVKYYGARTFFAVKYMHSMNIVYRDLKPENVLLDEDGKSRISDLGLAVAYTPNLKGTCGTRGYMAPEILSKDENKRSMKYCHSVDWFAFGCVLYEMAMGCSPFRSAKAQKWVDEKRPVKDGVSEKALNRREKVHVALMGMEVTQEFFEGDGLERDFSDLLIGLLKKNPKERLGHNGAHEIANHPWFRNYKHFESVEQDVAEPPFAPGRDIHADSQVCGPSSC